MYRFLRFLPLYALASLTSLAACGGSPVSAFGSGTSGLGGSSATCTDEQARANDYLSSHSSDWIDLSCTVDSDCEAAVSVASCQMSCGGAILVNRAGAAALAKAVAAVEAEICTSGCPDGPQPPCAEVPAAAIACVNGTCR